MSITEIQQYLFDLQGYLVIKDVLSKDEIDTLNKLIDAQIFTSPEERIRFGNAAGAAPSGPGFLKWGIPFCNLMDHNAVLPILRSLLGDCFRLDRIYGVQMNSGMSDGRLHADYGATADYSHAKQGEYFPFRDNRMRDGFIVVAWNLTAQGPTIGGFRCIPGSHKSHYTIPEEIREGPTSSPLIIPECPVGSCILFTESLTHGTAAWSAHHQRRTLLYKYCLANFAWSRSRVKPPPNVNLSKRQQLLLSEPSDPYRFFPSLFENEENIDY